MLSLKLREQVELYLSTEISLEELENWTVQNLPEIAADPQSDNSSFIATVDLCLAEYSDGIRSEDEIRHYLRDALEEFNTVYISNEQTQTLSESLASNTLQSSVAIGTNEFFTKVWS